jgi:ribosomal protein L22
MSRISQSKIVRNTFLPPSPERVRLQARLIRQAKAARDVEYLAFIRAKQAEVSYARMLTTRPAEPLCLMPPDWVVPPPSSRREQYTRHRLSRGEDSSDAS